MTNDKATELGTAPVGTLLLDYSLPAIAAMVVLSLYNVIDSIFIGQGVGAMAISGLAITLPIMNLTGAVGMLVGVGGGSAISLLMGQKNLPAATRVLGNVLSLNIINGIVVGAISIYFLDDILIAFGASSNTLPYAHDFLLVILIGQPITHSMFGLMHVMRASGYPKKAMLTALLTVGVNLILAPIFIFVLELGIRGASTATVLAQCTGLAWTLFHFYSPRSFIHFRRGCYRLRIRIMKYIFAIGMSPFLMNVCACGIIVFINKQLLVYGGDMAIGAAGILNRVIILFVMIVVGLTQGMQPIVGYNYGARKRPRVKQTLRYGIIGGVVITTFGFLATEFIPGLISRMFTDDETLIDLSITALRIATVFLPLVGCQIIIGNFFQSIGMAKISIFLALSRQLIFLLPCLYILPLFWGLPGVWWSLPVSDAIAFVTAVIALRLFFMQQYRAAKRRRIVRHEKSTAI